MLNHCNIDGHNPLLREWGIFAVRNLCEGNPDNQVSHLVSQPISQSVSQSVRLFRLAEKQGNPQAQFMLAQFYESGAKGLPKDVDKSIELFELAANQNIPEARLAVDRMNKSRDRHLASSNGDEFCVTVFVDDDEADEGICVTLITEVNVYK